jgi:hypothetical protein
MSQNALEEGDMRLNRTLSSEANPYEDDRETIKSDVDPEDNDENGDAPVLSEVNPNTNSEQFYDITNSQNVKNALNMKRSNYKDYSDFHDIPLAQSIKIATSEVASPADNRENHPDLEEVKQDYGNPIALNRSHQNNNDNDNYNNYNNENNIIRLHESVIEKEETKSTISEEEMNPAEPQTALVNNNLLDVFEVHYNNNNNNNNKNKIKKVATQGTSTEPSSDAIMQPRDNNNNNNLNDTNPIKIPSSQTIFNQNDSVVSDISRRDAEQYLYGNFDEDTLFPTKSEDKKLNKTIETQTTDMERVSSVIQSVLYKIKNFEISIPETKVVRDGMISSYTSYKLVTKLQDSDIVEISVHRRYSDFYWLYEELSYKYMGHIVPLPPPKNLLTALNKESTDFAENRRKELIVFMRKVTQDEFLKYTEEVNSFLFDDSKFNELKHQSEMIRNSKDEGLVKKFSKLLNSATKRPTGIKEMNENEKEIYNQEVFINTNLTKLTEFLTHFTKYISSKQMKTQETLATISCFDNIFYFDSPQASQNRIKDMSIVEDGTSKDCHAVEGAIKDLLQNLEAAKVTVERRKKLLEDYYDMQQHFEEYSLNIKKESLPHSAELERMKKEIELMKKKKKDSTLILIEKLREFRVNAEFHTNKILKTFTKLQSAYYSQLSNIWSSQKSGYEDGKQ